MVDIESKYVEIAKYALPHGIDSLKDLANELLDEVRKAPDDVSSSEPIQ